MAEISDADLAALQRSDRLVQDILGNPELGAKARTRAKELFPEAGITFIEDKFDPAISAMQARLDEESAARKALETTLAERDQAAADAKRASSMETALADARAKFRLTNEGFDMMVERMKETGNFADAEAAAAWAASKNPVVKEPSKAYLGPQTANFFGSAEPDEKMALLHKNPDRFVDNELREFLTDPDQYTRDAGFAA